MAHVMQRRLSPACTSPLAFALPSYWAVIIYSTYLGNRCVYFGRHVTLAGQPTTTVLGPKRKLTRTFLYMLVKCWPNNRAKAMFPLSERPEGRVLSETQGGNARGCCIRLELRVLEGLCRKLPPPRGTAVPLCVASRVRSSCLRASKPVPPHPANTATRLLLSQPRTGIGVRNISPAGSNRGHLGGYYP